ncbi:signal transduction histidine kinase [Actinokineospora baliensis]|uniref:PAS domain-containing sensor histidine kinase n=1 Tax=Actinokineospora baliensis TaxID=547056 RepID=UPI001959CEDA|nr:PAS domain-containing sensor histidine kinase [Actinokineospora baliensis]MBM7773360.1 signal transduction histidine kinase [Actinokineospora baliensis]
MSSDQAGQRARPALAGLLDEATRLLGGDDPAQVTDLLHEAVRGGLDPDDTTVLRSVIGLVSALNDRDDDVVPLPRSGLQPVADRALVVTVNPDGSMNAAPDALRDVLGYPLGTVDPHQLGTLVHPHDIGGLQRAYASLAASPGSQVEVDVRIRHADGRWLVLAVSMINLLETTGINAVVAHGHNVTEKRAADRALAVERARLRELVLHLAGGVVVDDGYRVLMDNTAFDRIFRPGREVTGATVAELLDLIASECTDPGVAWEMLDRMVRSGRVHRAVRLLLAGGRVVTCDLVPLRASSSMGTLWYFRDITRESVARSELEETNRALEEAANLKSRFVATVSHELRTPLTAVLAFAEMMEDTPEPLSAQQAAHLAVISRNANRLLRLVDDLLLLSRLETHQLSMSFTDIDVADLVTKATENHVPIGARAGISVTSAVGAGPHIHGDPARLTQVLDNVLTNALKFTRAGGAVRVEARSDAASWTISVSDTGIGVPAADLPGLFEAFTRASNAGAAGIPGSGLGLSICKQIVAVHQGAMSIESTEGVGTTVLVTLPAEVGVDDELGDARGGERRGGTGVGISGGIGTGGMGRR